MDNFQTLINTAIKALRAQTGLSQDRFAEKCNLCTDNYRNIEYNRHTPKASTIDRICAAFKITPIELLQFAYPETEKQIKVSKRLVTLNDLQLNMLNDFIDLLHKNAQ